MTVFWQNRKFYFLYDIHNQQKNLFIFRTYAIRRIRDGFKENKNLQEASKIQAELEFANKNLAIIHRQVM